MKKVATFFTIAAMVALSACGSSNTADETTAEETMDQAGTEMTEPAAETMDTMSAVADTAMMMADTTAAQ